MANKQELLWATDVHLDHVGHASAAFQFGKRLRDRHPLSRGLLLTGDIGEAATVREILRDVKTGYAGPVYFVLGNHDYYGSSFARLDHEFDEAFGCSDEQSIWLRQSPHWLLSADHEGGGIALVGNGGFYDGRYGDPSSHLELTDFTRIEELFIAQDENRRSLMRVAAGRADLLAKELSHQLNLVLSKKPRLVVVASHIPPFREAAFYRGKPSDDLWAPFFSSRTIGECLLATVNKHQQTKFVVLCGHTHGSGVFSPTNNLQVFTGSARYGTPDLAGRLDLDSGEIFSLKKG